MDDKAPRPEDELLPVLREWDTLAEEERSLPRWVQKWGQRDTALHLIACASEYFEPGLIRDAVRAIDWVYKFEDPPEEVSGAAISLALRASESDDPSVKAAGIWCLGSVESPTLPEAQKADIVLKALLHRERLVRREAQSALHAPWGAEVVERLLAALRERQHHRLGARWRFHALNEPATTPILRGIELSLPDLPAEARERVALGLGELLPHMRYPHVLWLATYILASDIGGRLGAEVLVRSMARYSGRIRAACAMALVWEIDYREVPVEMCLELLGRLLHQRNRSLRRLAKVTARGIRKRHLPRDGPDQK